MDFKKHIFQYETYFLMVSMQYKCTLLSLESQTATIKGYVRGKKLVKGDNIFACKIVAKLSRGRGQLVKWQRPKSQNLGGPGQEMIHLSKNFERAARLQQNCSSRCRLQTNLTQLRNCKIANWNMFTQFKVLLKMSLNKILHL